jgi:hypothetical protein
MNFPSFLWMIYRGVDNYTDIKFRLRHELMMDRIHCESQSQSENENGNTPKSQAHALYPTVTYKAWSKRFFPNYDQPFGTAEKDLFLGLILEWSKLDRKTRD